MATEIKQRGLGRVDRLTLLDPGIYVDKYTINGKRQYGLINKVMQLLTSLVSYNFRNTFMVLSVAAKINRQIKIKF